MMRSATCAPHSCSVHAALVVMDALTIHSTSVMTVTRNNLMVHATVVENQQVKYGFVLRNDQ